VWCLHRSEFILIFQLENIILLQKNSQKKSILLLIVLKKFCDENNLKIKPRKHSSFSSSSLLHWSTRFTNQMLRILKNNFFNNKFKRFIVLPKFVEELKKVDLRDYDVKYHETPQEVSFKIDKEEAFSNFDINESQLLQLSQNTKEYIQIAESFGFPDFKDNPVRFHPMNSSFLYIDPTSEIDKVLLQLTKDVPPLLWIPLKPTADVLKRTFEEFMEIEANAIKERLLPVDDMLKTIQNVEDETKKRKILLEYIDNIDPKTVIDPHPNTVHLFMGGVPNSESIENSLMNNSFLFNLPRIRGSSNKIVSNGQVVSSKFESIISRSLITIDVRNDLHMELEEGKSIPVFARINYPNNQKLSRPCTARYNRIFGTDYPDDMPIDVICAFFGNQMKGYQSLRKEIGELLDKQVTIAPFYIAHLAAMNDPNFDKIFETYSSHKDPMMRIACLKGAAELNMKSKIEELAKQETHVAVLEVLERIKKDLYQ
jgi:hypothetical protein